jgi:hypothetical protein
MHGERQAKSFVEQVSDSLLHCCTRAHTLCSCFLASSLPARLLRHLDLAERPELGLAESTVVADAMVYCGIALAETSDYESADGYESYMDGVSRLGLRDRSGDQSYYMDDGRQRQSWQRVLNSTAARRAETVRLVRADDKMLGWGNGVGTKAGKGKRKGKGKRNAKGSGGRGRSGEKEASAGVDVLLLPSFFKDAEVVRLKSILHARVGVATQQGDTAGDSGGGSGSSGSSGSSGTRCWRGYISDFEAVWRKWAERGDLPKSVPLRSLSIPLDPGVGGWGANSAAAAERRVEGSSVVEGEHALEWDSCQWRGGGGSKERTAMAALLDQRLSKLAGVGSSADATSTEARQTNEKPDTTGIKKDTARAARDSISMSTSVLLNPPPFNQSSRTAGAATCATDGAAGRACSSIGDDACSDDATWLSSLQRRIVSELALDGYEPGFMQLLRYGGDSLKTNASTGGTSAGAGATDHTFSHTANHAGNLHGYGAHTDCDMGSMTTAATPRGTRAVSLLVFLNTVPPALPSGATSKSTESADAIRASAAITATSVNAAPGSLRFPRLKGRGAGGLLPLTVQPVSGHGVVWSSLDRRGVCAWASAHEAMPTPHPHVK